MRNYGRKIRINRILTIDELKPGDLFGVPPSSWWQRWLCSIIQAKTFHWGVLVGRDAGGWITSESLGKGTALGRFVYERAYIYRMKNLGYEPSLEDLISIHSHYGDLPYDWDVSLQTAAGWLLQHYLGKTLPRWHDSEVNCQEWVVLVASELGCRLIPEDEYPMSVNLERSPYLQYLGEIIQ
jgi:hypothetical protein